MSLTAWFAASSLLLATGAPSPPPAATSVTATASDDALRGALDLLYAGYTDTALTQLQALVAENPDDPLALYFQALALCWKVEERPDRTDRDGELDSLVDRVLASTGGRRGSASIDDRLRLARGGALGVRCRLRLFRLRSRDAGRAAAAMRDELMPLRGRPPFDAEAQFGIGLYEYYVDVLPRAVRILRFLSGLPGGDRTRGLAEIEEAREHAAFHGIEATAQLYEIYAYYEDQPDRALAEIRALHQRYPSAPLWALKLADHLRDRLGRYGDSASAARDIVRAADEGDGNFGSVTTALGQLALGEALLLDLRVPEAQRALLAARDGLPPPSALRARLSLGRAAELAGDRATAVADYRAAARSEDPEVRHAAQNALARPVSGAELLAFPRLATARRLRESGRPRESADAYREALRFWDECLEARVRVAEDDLRHGRVPAARATVRAIAAVERPAPPWVRPWVTLLQGFLEDLDADRAAAVKQYNKVLQAPYGDPELIAEASRGLREPFRPEFSQGTPRPPSNNSK